MSRAAPFLLLLILAVGCAYPAFRDQRCPSPPAPVRVERWVPQVGPRDPIVRNKEDMPVLRLTGSGYERGWQYGNAFEKQWRFATARMDRAAAELVTDEVSALDPIAPGLVRTAATHVVQQVTSGDEVLARERLPLEHRAYIRGIADGAGLPIGSVLRMVAYVMLSDASCSAFVAFGPATADGRLLQLRSLDWGESGLPAEQSAVILIHEPRDGLRYVSPNIVGVVGALSGINEAGISVSEIGASSNDRTLRGMPMPLLLSTVLAQARTLEEAVAIFRKAPGTGGYNYMVGSARERRGVAIEKTARHTAVFEISADNYADNPFFFGYAGFDCRASTSADPTIRRYQEASRGEDGTPRGSSAYEKRYRQQIDLFESYGRVLDIEKAHAIAKAVAAGNNLHSILYDFDRGRVYFRNRGWFRDGRLPETDEDEMRVTAGAQPPFVIDLAWAFPPR